MLPVAIAAQPLAASSFRDYGHVLSLAEAGRVYHGGLIENRRPHAQLDLSLALVDAGVLPFALRLFERHPFSAQAFIPIDVAGYLVTVCPDDGTGQPDPSRAVSFMAGPDQAIVYAAGAWHHPMVALQRPGRFAIVMWTTGDDGDEELVPLAAPMQVINKTS
ncbi:MAG: ureidoglycolate lyase [Ferrovibrio sp.]|uniref:ureidoglycolate lyase n=1 Tax=Ferrovibrio sp. TaxID=1917215 RepID=UPI00391D2C41